MNTVLPRIIGESTDEINEPLKPSSDRSELSRERFRRSLRFERAIPEADVVDGTDESDELIRKKNKRRGKIKQLPLATASDTAQPRQASYDNRSEAHEQPLIAPATQRVIHEQPADSDSMADIAQHMGKLSADLLVGAAVTTTSLAELAGNVITLIGRLVLIFPGQFVHTCIMALGQRVLGDEHDFGEAFIKRWKAYRAIPNARHQIGRYQIPFSFIVGLSLLFPFLWLKFLELANAFIHLVKP